MNQAAKGNRNALVDLLGSIEQFVNPLDIRSIIPFTPLLVDIVAKIAVGPLTILALATKELK